MKKATVKIEDREKILTALYELIRDSIKKRATDIHFNCLENGGRIRIRVDGALQTVKTIDKKEYQGICDALKVMAALNLEERRLPQDGRCQLSIENKSVDLRISSVPSVFGENICMRILSREALCLDIGKAGFNEQQLKTVRKWYNKPHGAVLVTGPMGSGKTTVMYMILNELNRESRNVISVEEPVEYTIPGVNQIQINPRAGLTFSAAMRAILRQDPDVIMVGEIRDLETSQMIVQAAITGHFILSTLHTNTATDAVIRLKDIGIEPFLIRDTVTGIINQRLVRVLCKDCKEKYLPDDITLQRFGLEKKEYYKAAGCKNCNNSGYRGRRGIFELYEPSQASMNMLIKGCNGDELRKQAISDGMITLLQDGLDKAAQGITTLEEVAIVTGGV
jgi:type IV pilus assembly protein PilB